MKKRAEELIKYLKELINENKLAETKEREEKAKQLLEIENAISNLEKSTIPVPQELRNLKDKLSLEVV